MKLHLDSNNNLHIIDFYGHYIPTEIFIQYLQNPKLTKEYIIDNYLLDSFLIKL